jgi:hypothetical protein
MMLKCITGCDYAAESSTNHHGFPSQGQSDCTISIFSVPNVNIIEEASPKNSALISILLHSRPIFTYNILSPIILSRQKYICELCFSNISTLCSSLKETAFFCHLQNDLQNFLVNSNRQCLEQMRWRENSFNIHVKISVINVPTFVIVAVPGTKLENVPLEVINAGTKYTKSGTVRSALQLLVAVNVLSSSLILPTLMMEAIRSLKRWF